MARKALTFVLTFAVWCLLAYAGPEGWNAYILGFGAVASLIVALIFAEVIALAPGKLLNPVRWFWLLVYLCVFVYSAVAAALHVMYIVLHPDLPIKPGVVKVKTRLKGAAARTALCTSITLTPGTLVLDITQDGVLYVHWLEMKTAEMRSATEAIVERYEGLIEKVLE